MIVLGLTGGLAMGKSTVAEQFAFCGAKTANADQLVHSLLSKGGAAVGQVANAFPSVERDGAIDRKALGAIVFNDAKKLKQLEAILHPMVREAEQAFARKQQKLGARLVVLDIPLLFETGADARCDATATVTAPAFVQKQRAMRRAGMTEEKFYHILSFQMPDREKIQRADYVIPTGLGRGVSFVSVRRIMDRLLGIA